VWPDSYSLLSQTAHRHDQAMAANLWQHMILAWEKSNVEFRSVRLGHAQWAVTINQMRVCSATKKK